MEHIDNILTSLTRSIDQSIKDFAECKDLSQKKSQAEIIKLLCESMGVFFNAMNNSDPYLFDDYYYDDYEDEDEDYEMERNKKSKKVKKIQKDNIPF